MRLLWISDQLLALSAIFVSLRTDSSMSGEELSSYPGQMTTRSDNPPAFKDWLNLTSDNSSSSNRAAKDGNTLWLTLTFKWPFTPLKSVYIVLIYHHYATTTTPAFRSCCLTYRLVDETWHLIEVGIRVSSRLLLTFTYYLHELMSQPTNGK